MTFIHVLRWLGALGLALPAMAEPAAARYPGWEHSGSLWPITTPEGANLPATASESDFPLLVRLHRDFFPFQQAKPNGEDLRFSDSAKAPLSYEIEEWDARQGTASVWVRIPRITGNTRQEITVHWGRPDATSESSGPAVFGGSNGYLSVWHLSGPPRDAVGTLDSMDVGTTSTPGRIGWTSGAPCGCGSAGGMTSMISSATWMRCASRRSLGRRTG